MAPAAVRPAVPGGADVPLLATHDTWACGWCSRVEQVKRVSDGQWGSLLDSQAPRTWRWVLQHDPRWKLRRQDHLAAAMDIMCPACRIVPFRMPMSWIGGGVLLWDMEANKPVGWDPASPPPASVLELHQPPSAPRDVDPRFAATVTVHTVVEAEPAKPRRRWPAVDVLAPDDPWVARRYEVTPC